MLPSEAIGLPPSAPAPFRRISPYLLELRERGGWLAALFGVPFFLAGVFMALGLTDVSPYEATLKRYWDFLVLPLISIGFLGMGGVMLFGRRRLTVDLRAGSVIRQLGLIVPLRNEVRRLSDFTAVVISCDSGDSDSPERFPVRFRAASGKDFVISKPLRFSEARKQAEYLSRSLRLPLADTTSDHETVVSPEQAGDSLRDRLLCAETESERPIPPPGMRYVVGESSSGITKIVIPGPKFPLPGVLSALASVVIFFLVITAVGPGLLRNSGSGGVPTAFLILVLLLSIPVMISGIHLIVGSRRRRTTIHASQAGLVIERRGAWRMQSKIIEASEILDVDQSTFLGSLQWKKESGAMAGSSDLPNEGFLATLRKSVLNKGIVVKSRQELVTFGEGLRQTELQYLTWVLRRALAG